ncbi:TylF/MycF/NovP-related O-methyltransferase [Bradyrhizobium sp. 1200_D9_N1_1]|uniref:TylF/MycF/NovP-related O-methyltransferase n=1 Tax=Bradyrhizobium sp. 1200_D9_N1_1 TaxID=3239013 RepID=UPI003F8B7439
MLREASNAVSSLQTDYQRFELAERLFNLLVPSTRISEFGRTYFEDPEFAAIYERFSEGNYRAYDRRWTVAQLARHAISLGGAFAECGVYRGATAYLTAKALHLHGAPHLKLHLFDSFSGLSAPSSVDGSYWRAGDMASGLEEVRANLAEWSDRVVMHPGWIPERFLDVAADRFAFVHIDVDLFQPTRESLSFFYQRMLPGGIILCDDYGFASCPGARTAMDQFFADKDEEIIHLPTGQGLVIFPGR